MMLQTSFFYDSLVYNQVEGIPVIEAEYLNNPFIIQALFTLSACYLALRGHLQDIIYKLNLYNISKTMFHKFYIDYFILMVSTKILITSLYFVNFLDLNLLNLLGPRGMEKGSYHTNRFINLFYSGNLVSYLLLNLIGITVGLFLFIY